MRAPRLAELSPAPLLRPVLIVAVALGIVLFSVATTVYSPVLAMLAAGVFLAVALLTQGSLPRLFIWTLGGLLIGYAFLGRGLAHVGIAPLYIGEMVLGLGVLTIIANVGKLRLQLIEWLILAFIALGLARTLPYIGTYGLDAPRDGVLWIYSILALAIPLALRLQGRLEDVVGVYRRVLPFFLLWVPIAGVLHEAAPGLVPAGPGSEVSLLVFKGGDMGAHLAGAAAFIASGLYWQGTGWRLPAPVIWSLWIAGLAVAGLSRGGLLSAMVGLGAAFCLRPSIRVLQFAVVAVLVLSLAAWLNLRLDISRYSGREISVNYFASSLQSIYKDDGGSLQGTKDFRLEWWGEIVSYTFKGPYFWTGKGFGVNLADDDGFQVDADGSLRAPHNSHMTVLARMGVPGFALWLALQGAFGISMLRACLRAGRAGLGTWAGINGWILTYWLAMNVNTAFDPYLEGPQGGIWFWSLIGLGLFVLQAQTKEVEEAEGARRSEGLLSQSGDSGARIGGRRIATQSGSR